MERTSNRTGDGSWTAAPIRVLRAPLPLSRLLALGALLALPVASAAAQEPRALDARLAPLSPSPSFNRSARAVDANLWHEAGYVLAMETVFVGMSLLASHEDGRLRAVTGGFDAFMGVAGINNALVKTSRAQRVGHFVIAAGFLTKAAFNFGLMGGYTQRERFLVNCVGFNVLVFSGYYLDTLD